MAPNLLKSLFEELLQKGCKTLSENLRYPKVTAQRPRKSGCFSVPQASSLRRSRGWVNVCLLARIPWAWRGEAELPGVGVRPFAGLQLGWGCWLRGQSEME